MDLEVAHIPVEWYELNKFLFDALKLYFESNFALFYTFVSKLLFISKNFSRVSQNNCSIDFLGLYQILRANA